MHRMACLALLLLACGDLGVGVRDAGPAEDVDAGGGATDAGSTSDSDRAPDAGHPPLGAVDSGAPGPVDAGPGAAPPGLTCAGASLRDESGREVGAYDDAATCERVREAAGEGVVCGFFRPGDPIGPGAWEETGWRPMSVRSGVGLGRVPHDSLDDCLAATRSSRGGVVCIHTGIGYKAAHLDTNQWCGSSSALRFCLEATAAARDHWVCSFPSDGDGSGPGWTVTHIDGTSCDYGRGGLSLSDCNTMIP